MSARAISEERLERADELIQIARLEVGFLIICKSEQLGSQFDASIDGFPRRADIGAHAFRLIGPSFGQPQAGFDDRQKVFEIMGNTRGHLAQERKTMHRALVLLGCLSAAAALRVRL
nr:hypothetical protein [Rhizobium gallicum]